MAVHDAIDNAANEILTLLSLMGSDSKDGYAVMGINSKDEYSVMGSDSKDGYAVMGINSKDGYSVIGSDSKDGYAVMGIDPNIDSGN